MKILTIIGTRPEIIKLSLVMKKLDKYTNHIIAHTGQNYDYELNQVFFDDLGIRKPDYFLEAVGDNLGHTIGNIIAKTYDLLLKEKPDAILVYGDTNSCLSVISAKRLHIPIFHMEAGNRCFDQRVPEENNRKIVDHLSDINMVLSEHARKYLEREGVRPEQIINTGSSMKEIFDVYKQNIDNSSILNTLKLSHKDYFVFSAHREENTDYADNFTNLIETLEAIATKYNKRIIFSTHPRTKNKLEEFNIKNLNPLIEFSKPFGFFDYIHLQKNAYCVISDSGTITEESSLLKFPAITPRNAHERPEGMDKGVLIMSGLKKENVLDAIDTVVSQGGNDNFEIVNDYNVNNVSDKVIRIIKSYTNYINQYTWHKE